MKGRGTNASVRSEGTRPERRVRQALLQMGLHYRINFKGVPGHARHRIPTGEESGLCPWLLLARPPRMRRTQPSWAQRRQPRLLAREAHAQRPSRPARHRSTRSDGLAGTRRLGVRVRRHARASRSTPELLEKSFRRRDLGVKPFRVLRCWGIVGGCFRGRRVRLAEFLALGHYSQATIPSTARRFAPVSSYVSRTTYLAQLAIINNR